MKGAYAGHARSQQNSRAGLHACHQVLAIATSNAVRDLRPASSRERDRPVRFVEVGSIAHEDDEVGRALEATHRFPVLGTKSARSNCAKPRKKRRALDPETIAVIVT